MKLKSNGFEDFHFSIYENTEFTPRDVFQSVSTHLGKKDKAKLWSFSFIFKETVLLKTIL